MDTKIKAALLFSKFVNSIHDLIALEDAVGTVVFDEGWKSCYKYLDIYLYNLCTENDTLHLPMKNIIDGQEYSAVTPYKVRVLDTLRTLRECAKTMIPVVLGQEPPELSTCILDWIDYKDVPSIVDTYYETYGDNGAPSRTHKEWHLDLHQTRDRWNSILTLLIDRIEDGAPFTVKILEPESDLTRRTRRKRLKKRFHTSLYMRYTCAMDYINFGTPSYETVEIRINEHEFLMCNTTFRSKMLKFGNRAASTEQVDLLAQKAIIEYVNNNGNNKYKVPASLLRYL